MNKEAGPRKVTLKDMTDANLQSMLQALNEGIESRPGCTDCPDPLVLIQKRDEIEDEIELRK